MKKYLNEQINYIEFTEDTWIEILNDVQILCNLTKKEYVKIKHSPVAKLVASIPYFASCKNPDQISVLKTAMFLSHLRIPKRFSHRCNQSIRERIEIGTSCQTGNAEVVQLITSILELVSIKDHIHDFENDIIVGHPNPIGSEIIWYFKRKEDIEKEIINHPNQLLIRDLKRILDPFIVDYWY